MVLANIAAASARRLPAEAMQFIARPVGDFRRDVPSLAEEVARRAMKGMRMQPTKQEIDSLRAISRWLKAGGGDAHTRIRIATDTIDKAIALIESGHDSVTEMLLVAFHQGMVPLHGNRWDIVDADLVDFASRALVERFGPNPGAPRPEPRQKFRSIE